ncbi:MAG: HAMP domain-containing histidine kinase [Planctomycetaceae bacterium]|nr:HAMP domain-containing histidine kinase [Planctomycetaceae bacterium]
MSETAHDLRSPLTTVQESIRLIKDGEQGDLTSDQLLYLTSAMDQCDCMFQMIDEMVQLERLRTGIPRVHRQWISISEIRKSIDETLRPWALPRKIDVLWDIMLDAETKVYADLALVRRLVVNLATNAIRVTPENGVVLVQLQRPRSSSSVRWAIIDRGGGIKRKVLQRMSCNDDAIDSTGAVTGSMSGGEGLGLLISRQLAALHFSDLQICSRFGQGTEVSFATVFGGPRGVADAWSNWRMENRTSLRKPRHRDGRLQRVDQGNHLAAEKAAKKCVESPIMSVKLSHNATRPRCDNKVVAGIVSLGAAVPRSTADMFDHFMQRQQRMYDFVYRVESRQWVWAFDLDLEALEARIESISDAVIAQIPDARMTWSEPQIIPLGDRVTHSRLSDLLVRSTLAASSSTNVNDQDEVRLGTLPIGESKVAASRLDNELRRLTGRFRSESRVLAKQVEKLSRGI